METCQESMGNSVSLFRKAADNYGAVYCAGNPLSVVGSHNGKLKRFAKTSCDQLLGEK
jgi:hypothetical protein